MRVLTGLLTTMHPWVNHDSNRTDVFVISNDQLCSVSSTTVPADATTYVDGFDHIPFVQLFDKDLVTIRNHTPDSPFSEQFEQPGKSDVICF